jgi:hypothetical protein
VDDRGKLTGAIDAGEAIAFEDSPSGVLAAKAAGVFCVVVPNDLIRGAPGLEAGELMLESLSSISLSQLVALSPWIRLRIGNRPAQSLARDALATIAVSVPNTSRT